MPGLNRFTQNWKTKGVTVWGNKLSRVFPLSSEFSAGFNPFTKTILHGHMTSRCRPQTNHRQTNGHDQPPNHGGSATFSTPQQKDMVLPVVFMSFFLKQTMKKHLILKLEAWFRIKQKKNKHKDKKNNNRATKMCFLYVYEHEWLQPHGLSLTTIWEGVLGAEWDRHVTLGQSRGQQ